MDQTLISEEAAKINNSTDFGTDFEVNAAMEDDIGSHDLENGPVAETIASPSEIKIPRDNKTEHGGSLLPVNTRNGKDYTAVDLRKNIKPEPEPEPSVVSKIKNKCFPNAYMLLTGSVLIAGSTYTSVFNVNPSSSSSSDAENESFTFKDVILCRLPDDFYSAMFMTVAFTLSMVGVGVSLRSMIKKWSFRSSALPLVGLGTFFASFAFTMKQNLPKFWVTFESFNFHFKISSFWLVWLYGLSLILAPLTIFPLPCSQLIQ